MADVENLEYGAANAVVDPVRVTHETLAPDLGCPNRANADRGTASNEVNRGDNGPTDSARGHRAVLFA